MSPRPPTIHFRDEGGGRGTPFVFIHGWACDSSAWAPQIEDLKRDHRCISVDLRGRGESAAVAPYDVFTAAADVASVIRSLQLPPVIAVGHSLGGIVALCLNRAEPELVAGVVTGDSPLELDAPRR
ncbi:MAG: alpha/beta hydrolase, partial [Anaerolineaceae bacterium]